jgi:phage terminase large subunit-like protein
VPPAPGDQAKIAFWTAQEMARRSPDFRRSPGVEALAHRIVQARSASYFEAVSADADSLEGKNVHFGLIDEFHAHRSRDVYDAIETGAGKRDQSMLWAITTGGSDILGICFEGLRAQHPEGDHQGRELLRDHLYHR